MRGRDSGGLDGMRDGGGVDMNVAFVGREVNGCPDRGRMPCGDS